MNVALAHDHLFQIGGAEQVLRAIHSLYPHAPLYTLICSPDARNFFKNADIHTSVLQKLPGGVSYFKYYLQFMPVAWEQFDFSEYDVVISSSSAFVKGLITGTKTLHISYCHTPTRYLWSDRVEYVESLRMPRLAKAYLLQALTKLRAWDEHASARVDYYIANSQFVANRIKKYYRRESTIIYPPVPVQSFTVAENIGEYYLVVSRLRPYKRVDLAIEAFNRLRLPLRIIGSGEEYGYLKRMAKSNISFLGEVTDEERNKQLSHCRALIHPQEEDFGISVIEAMASGRPVIAFRAGGAMETIVDGKTGVFFEDQTWESLAYAVLTAAKTQFDKMYIRRHAEQFDVSKFNSAVRSFVEEKYQEYRNDSGY